MKKRFWILGVILITILVGCGYFVFRSKFKADVAGLNLPSWIATNSNQKSDYISNQILIKLNSSDTQSVRTKAATRASGPAVSIDINDSGVHKLDLINKSLKASKIDKIVSGFGSTSTRSSGSNSAAVQAAQNNLDQWYAITLSAKPAVISQDPNIYKPGVSNGIMTDMTMKEVLDFYKNNGIDDVSLNYVYHADAVPNDEYLTTRQITTDHTDLWNIQQIQADQVWDQTKGKGVVVAVVDSGVDYNHPDLKDNIDRDASGNIIGYNFVNNTVDPMDDLGHGTHVAGTIAAEGNNDPDHSVDGGTRVIGVGPELKIMPVKVLDSNGNGSLTNLVAGLKFAADNGAKVINNSWGGSQATPVFDDILDYIYQKNIVDVFAAGNSNLDVYWNHPGGNSKVITVGASNSLDQRSCYSNYGDYVDFLAPGGDSTSPNCFGGGSKNDTILSTRLISKPASKEVLPKLGDDYSGLIGTSMATPAVSGAAGLILSVHPDWTPEQVRFALRNSADQVDGQPWNYKTGFGRINIKKALALDAQPTPVISNYKYASYPKEIDGTVTAVAGIKSWKVEIGKSITPSSWQTIGSGTSAIGTSGLLAKVPDGLDGVYLVRLSATDNEGQTSTTYTDVSEDSHLMSGWPKWVSNRQPIVADINNDGINEIITMQGNELDVFKSDGSILFKAKSSVNIYSAGYYSTFPFNLSPAVADINNDGKLEIIFTMNTFQLADDGTVKSVDSYLNAVDNQGNVVHGWPIDIHNEFISAPSVFDMNNNGKKEIMVESDFSKLYAFNADGTSVAGWPVSMKNSQKLSDAYVYGNLQVADVDGDGKNDIVASDPGAVYVIDANGTLKKSWNVNNAANGLEIGAADINGDGKSEIIARTIAEIVYGSSAGSDPPPVLSVNYTVYAWSAGPNYSLLWQKNSSGLTSGNVFAYGDTPPVFIPTTDKKGFNIFVNGGGLSMLIDNNGNLISQSNGFWESDFPSIADVNNDGKLDISGGDYVLGQSKLCINSLGQNGSLVMQKACLGSETAPSFADVDGDGKLEMVASALTYGIPSDYPSYGYMGFYAIYVWKLDTGVPKNSIVWGQEGGDAGRSGIYGNSIPNIYSGSYDFDCNGKITLADIFPITAFNRGSTPITAELVAKDAKQCANLGNYLGFELQNKVTKISADELARVSNVIKQSILFNIKITKTGDGSGVLNQTTRQVGYGSNLVITATPDAGSSFKGWTGCDSVSSNTCTLSNITTDKNISATFTLNLYPMIGTTHFNDKIQSGVKVTLTNSVNVVVATATSDRGGKYQFPKMKSGTYTLTGTFSARATKSLKIGVLTVKIPWITTYMTSFKVLLVSDELQNLYIYSPDYSGGKG